MQIRGFIRLVNTGGPVPDGTEVALRRHVDDSLIATVTTVGGMYEYFMNGSPGPYYTQAAVSDEVHISSSQVVGMSGPLDVGGLPLYFRLWDDGYIADVALEGEPFSTGSGMQVSVRSGVFLVKGVLYDQADTVNVSVDAAEASPRIDTLVVEVMMPGSGIDVEGRSRLVVKKGTAAATPVVPTLTQTTTIWEHPIADIRVDTGVSSIASNKVTDRRVRAHTIIGDRYITGAMVQLATLLGENIADATIPGAKVQLNTISEGNLDAAVKEKLNASSQIKTNDTTFPRYGVWESTAFATAASSYVILTPGTWIVESTVDLDVLGTGASGSLAGTFGIRFRNEGVPGLTRYYRSSPGIFRSVQISERQEITTDVNVQVDVDFQVAHVADGESPTDFRDGYMVMKAWRV